MCRVPPSINIQTVTYTDRVSGVSPQSAAVTQNGTLSIFPTPGHANGHQLVLIEDEGRSVCIAGDAAFTQDQVKRGEIAGIVENHRDAVQSAKQLKAQVTQFQTILLPTHDPHNTSRLRQLNT